MGSFHLSFYSSYTCILVASLHNCTIASFATPFLPLDLIDHATPHICSKISLRQHFAATKWTSIVWKLSFNKLRISMQKQQPEHTFVQYTEWAAQPRSNQSNTFFYPSHNMRSYYTLSSILPVPCASCRTIPTSDPTSLIGSVSEVGKSPLEKETSRHWRDFIFPFPQNFMQDLEVHWLYTCDCTCSLV